jgi:hypothetical protein
MIALCCYGKGLGRKFKIFILPYFFKNTITKNKSIA